MKPAELKQLQELLPDMSMTEETVETMPAEAQTTENVAPKDCDSAVATSTVSPYRWSAAFESHTGAPGMMLDHFASNPIWSKLPGRNMMGARALSQVPFGAGWEQEVQVLNSREQLRTWRRAATNAGRQVALVPTMGNLHEGHLELVDEAKKHTDDVIVSIFVNPAQFAAHEDLDKYPRTMERDLELLRARGVAAVFAPTPADIYPDGSPGATLVVPTFVEGKSEAACRPEHFAGVATVCLKLFNLCEPNVVVFGQKDAMQCSVIDRMLKDLMLEDRISLIVAPTSREKDGLARSSRNSYLTPDMRQKAPAIYAALTEATKPPDATPGSIRTAVHAALSNEGMEVSYVSVAHSKDMSEKDDEEAISNSVVSVACLLRDGDQECRLLDNVVVTASF
jgi:pantoate--beta-alanine ligase